jgi:hypothetical protein
MIWQRMVPGGVIEDLREAGENRFPISVHKANHKKKPTFLLG